MASLGVNIDHIANVRQARRTVEPDPVSYALLAELGGADGITVHLREDRRHIQDRDVERLRQTVRSRLNLLLAAAFTRAQRQGSLANGLQFDPARLSQLADALVNRPQGKTAKLEAVSRANSDLADPIAVDIRWQSP